MVVTLWKEAVLFHPDFVPCCHCFSVFASISLGMKAESWEQLSHAQRLAVSSSLVLESTVKPFAFYLTYSLCYY